MSCSSVYCCRVHRKDDGCRLLRTLEGQRAGKNYHERRLTTKLAVCATDMSLSYWTSSRHMLIILITFALGSLLNVAVLAEGFEYKGNENNGCSAAKRALAGHHAEIPTKMMTGQQLHVCSAPDDYTCCTSDTEAELVERSRTDFNKIIVNRTNSYRQMFSSRGSKLSTYVVELINRSRESLHDMFIRTYGQLYQQNAELFTDLFSAFQMYIEGQDVDLVDTLDELFVELMRRMFAMVNGIEQNQLSDAYVTCMTGHMDRLRPFGDAPVKLASQVKRAFVAVKALIGALSTGRDVVGALTKMEPSLSCVHALTRMFYCPYCRGLSDAKPCQTLCLNVARGCLATRADVNDIWNNYIDEMLKLSSRVKGPFNIASVVSPIDVKLSDAIMNFQEHAQSLSSKIFQGCGNIVSRTRRDVHSPNGSTNAINDDRTRLPHTPSVRKHSTLSKSRLSNSDSYLEPLIDELTQRLQQAKDLWKQQLTSALCSSNAGSVLSPASASPRGTTQVEQDEMCWNGKSKSRYALSLVGDGTRNQTLNPEVQPQATKSAIVDKTILQLQQTITGLRQAFNGQDLSRNSIDTEYDGSGSGDHEEISGSGIGCDDLCISRAGVASTSTRYPIVVITDTGVALPTVANSSKKLLLSASGITWWLLVVITTTMLGSSVIINNYRHVALW